MIVEPAYVLVGNDIVPSDAGIPAEEIVVPGFIWVGCNDIPGDARI